MKCDASPHLKACGHWKSCWQKVAGGFGSPGILRTPRLAHREQSLMASTVYSDKGHQNYNSCDPAMETSSATSFNPAANSFPRTEMELISPGTLLYPCLSWPCAPAFPLSFKQFWFVRNWNISKFLFYMRAHYSGLHFKVVEWDAEQWLGRWNRQFSFPWLLCLILSYKHFILHLLR